MATKRLGKGLSAIIKTDVNPSVSKKGVNLLPLDSIKINPNQPRKNFEKDALNPYTIRKMQQIWRWLCEDKKKRQRFFKFFDAFYLK